MGIPSPLAFPPTALRNVAAGLVVGNPIGSSGTRAKALTSAELKAIVEASGISYLPSSGGTLTGSLTGTSITLAQGSLQSGGLSFSGAGGANIYGRGQMFVFGTANTNALEVAFDYARVARESWIGWSDGSYNASSNTVRVALFSDAVGTVNQRNALNAQCHVINKSYTSVSSQEALMLDAGKQISSKLGLYSYRGSAGGSNYPIQIGMLAADGTTFSGLTVETNGGITANSNITLGGGTYRIIGQDAARHVLVMSNSIGTSLEYSAYGRVLIDSDGVAIWSGDGTNWASRVKVNTVGKLTLFAASTTTASLNIPSGVAPTSPVNGDIWSDGSDLKVRLGGATYTLSKV